MYISISKYRYKRKQSNADFPLKLEAKFSLLATIQLSFLKLQYSKKNLLFLLLMSKLCKNIYHTDQHYSHVHQDSLPNTDFV